MVEVSAYAGVLYLPLPLQNSVIMNSDYIDLNLDSGVTLYYKTKNQFLQLEQCCKDGKKMA